MLCKLLLLGVIAQKYDKALPKLVREKHALNDAIAENANITIRYTADILGPNLAAMVIFQRAYPQQYLSLKLHAVPLQSERHKLNLIKMNQGKDLPPDH